MEYALAVGYAVVELVVDHVVEGADLREGFRHCVEHGFAAFEIRGEADYQHDLAVVGGAHEHVAWPSSVVRTNMLRKMPLFSRML